MSVEIADSKRVYAGDGSTADWPTPFFALSGDIVAYYRPAAGGSIRLVLDQDYSLSGAGQPLGGTLTILDGAFIPSPTTGNLIVTTAVPATQLRRFARSGAFDTKQGEAAWDKLTVLCQQILQQLGASLRAPLDDLAGDMTLPRDRDRANTFQAYDAAGLPSFYSLAALSNLLQPLILGSIVTKTTVLSREELGLVGDGVTDDSPAYNKAVDLWSARGGATFFLQPREGASFYFKYPIRNKSFVQTIFSGAACRLSAAAYIGIEGQLSEEYGDAPLTLVSDASAGASALVVDTGPQNGLPLSSLMNVGDRIAVRGKRDPASNLVEYGEYIVSALDDGLRTITVVGTLGSSYQVAYADNGYQSFFGIANVTQVTRVIDGVLTVDAAVGASNVTVASWAVGRFAVDDWVMLHDFALASDLVTGAEAASVRCEILKITGIGVEGVNTLTFNRRAERVYQTSHQARVTLLDPALRATIDGASVVFTAAPSDIINTFQISRAVECAITNPQVPNEDAFGSFGAMFQFYESVDCRIIRPNGRNPKSVTGNNGYGVVLERSTSCSVVEPIISGCRQNILFITTTQCSALDVELDDDRLVSVGWAGFGEVGDAVSIRMLTGGSQIASGETKRRAIRFGSPTGMVGPSRCLVEDGRVAQYSGSNTACVEFMPGQSECAVRGVQFDDIGTLLWHGDNALAATLIADTAAIEDFVVNGYTAKLIDVAAQRNGSTTRTLANLTLRGRAYGGSLHVFLANVNGCDLANLSIRAGSVAGANPYALDATDVIGLAMLKCLFRDCGRGIALRNCTGFVARTDFQNQLTDTVVLQDNGGNTVRWRYNDALDFAPTKEVTGTASAGLAEWPLPISATADYVRIT